jgi:hypothetical protein
MHALVKLLMWSGLLLLVLGLWKQNDLPDAINYARELLQEPEQVAVQQAPFQKTVGGITYTIYPRYRYTLNGMVVSLHDTGSWQDYLHQQWNDRLNVMDLCVIWGKNVSGSAWRDIEFSSGQFTCNFFTRSHAAFVGFDQTGISNNHLLTANAGLAKQLREVRIGDQVQLRGYLAEYAHNHGFPFRRGTSTVRTDTGNGACETIYVEEMAVLRPYHSTWRLAKQLGLMLLVVGVLGWLALPVRIR